MDERQRIIYSVIEVLMLGGTTYFLLDKNFHRKSMGVIQWVIKGALFPLLFLLSLEIKNTIVMGVIQFLLLFFVIEFLYEAKKLEIILFLFVEQFVYLICPMVCFSALTFLAGDKTSQMILDESSFVYSVSMLIFVYLIAGFVMFFILRILFDTKREWPLFQNIFFMIALILCVVCLLSNIQFLNGTGLVDKNMVYQSSILPLVLFFFFFADVIYSEKYYGLKMQMEKREIFDSFASKQNEYYSILQEQQREMQKLNHDMKNHLLVLQANKEVSEVYGKELLLKIDEKMEYSDTGNGIADIIFFEKEKEAKERQIKMSIGVEEGILKQVAEIEICTILTNALDNAIEACLKVDRDDRKIQLKGTKVPAWIVLVIENTCKEEPDIQDGKIVTSKEDKKNHGFGLENISQAVETLSGSMDICYKDGIFRLSILLPDRNQKE